MIVGKKVVIGGLVKLYFSSKFIKAIDTDEWRKVFYQRSQKEKTRLVTISKNHNLVIKFEDDKECYGISSTNISFILHPDEDIKLYSRK